MHLLPFKLARLLSLQFLLSFSPRLEFTSRIEYLLLNISFQSPRWLISVGRKEEARKILAKYHGNGDEHAPLVELEWKEFEEGIEIEGSDKRWLDFKTVHLSLVFADFSLGGTTLALSIPETQGIAHL